MNSTIELMGKRLALGGRKKVERKKEIGEQLK